MDLALSNIFCSLTPSNLLKIACFVNIHKTSCICTYRKHFIDTHAFHDHIKSKPHKRRLKALETEPYTIEESQRAAGMGSYTNPRKRKMETCIPDAVKAAETINDIKKRAKILSDGDTDMK